LLFILRDYNCIPACARKGVVTLQMFTYYPQLYRGTKKMRFLRDMQMSCRRASIFIGALLGNLEGIRLPGLLREMNSISEYRCEAGSHSGFKSEWGFNLTQIYISGFLPFGPRG